MHETVHSIDPPSEQGLEKRFRPREVMALPILLAWSGGRHSALLRNLSRGGAKIEVSAALMIDDKVEVHCGSICASGAVLWRGVSSFGIKFTELIADEQVTEQISRAEAVARWRTSRAAR